jgi:DNA gyrase subunit B
MANQYNEDSIQILESQEAVRTRPAMYIGDTGKKGLHHLVWEILDNSVDEHMAGHCTKIDIIVSKDNRSVTIIDNGRGIPVAVKQEDPKKRSTLEIVLTELHAGGKFGDDGSGYEASGGLHGVGASCVNFLSLRLDAEVYRDKKKYLLSFDRGIAASGVTESGTSSSTGTKITFTPDYNIFGQFAVEDAFREVLVDEFDIDENFAECSGKWRKVLIGGPVDIDVFKQCFGPMNYDDAVYTKAFNSWFNHSWKNIQFDETVLVRRIRETAYLNGGLKINYKNDHTGTKEEFHFEGGIADYVSYLASTKSNLYPSKPFFFDNKSGKINVQVAFQYGDDDEETIYTYANNIYTLDGGTHLSGFKTSITRIVNQFARSSSVLKEKDPNLTGEDIRDGIVAIISVRLPQPQFEGQTKGKLGSQEVEGVVNRLFSEAVTEYFEKNPNIVKFISERALRSARARAAAKKASENIKRQSFLGRSGSLPGKLSDCNSEDNVNTELFIVEGDSAAGCFVGSTRISLADGREISFIELIEEQEKGIQNFCYTVRNDGQIGLAEIKHARLTKKNAELVKVILDNGESVICTPDHKWMKSDGSYIRADEMSEGLSLYPLYRKISSKKEKSITIDGYEMTWMPNALTWVFTHKMADWWNLWKGVYTYDKTTHCHHVDFNKRNNNPNNLVRMDKDEHLKLHRDHASLFLHSEESKRKSAEAKRTENFRLKARNQMLEPENQKRLVEHNAKIWSDPEYKEFMKTAWKNFYLSNETYRQEVLKTLNEEQKKYWSSEENRLAQSIRVKEYFQNNPEAKENNRKKAIEQWSDESLRRWRSEKTKEQMTDEFKMKRKATLDNTNMKKMIAKVGAYLQETQKDTIPTQENALYQCFQRLVKKFFNNDKDKATEACKLQNHKIVSIEKLNYTEDVYDIEVPDSHNFALTSGVFVHNSSKFGRDPEFQAVMPIRGKIINPEKNDYARLMQNEEVSSIISALGTGIRDDFKIEDLRYGKIVIMTDADDDGAHIAALLMTFFYRFMRPLVLAGKLYIAKPPLYRVNVKNQKFYIHSNEELESYRNKYGDKIEVTRFKGLGEMDGDELGVTTMEIGTRHIIKVAVENAEEASDLISTLMGSEVAPRKEHIIKKSAIRAGEENV